MANLKKISTFAASKSTSFHIFPVKSIKKTSALHYEKWVCEV